MKDNSTSTSSTSTSATTITTTTTSSTTSTTSIPINVQHYHGITLQAIGLTLVGGLCVSTLSIVAFGLALLSRHTNIAPRCTMRHPNTIWRSRREIYSGKKRRRMKNQFGGGDIGDSSGDGEVGGAAVAANTGGALIVSQWKNKLLKWWGTAKAEEEAVVVGSVKSCTIASHGTTAADFLEMMPCQELTRPSTSVNKSMMKQPPQQHSQRQQHKHQHVFKSNSTNSANATQYYDPTMTTGGGGTSTRRRRGGVESVDPFTTDTTSTNNGNFTSVFNTNNNSLPVPTPSSPITTTTTTQRHPQDRGNPFLGWIPWTLHLSYDRMLRGIPGTGTRSRGLEGKLLGVNLDAIVLFRYHALCLRVTAVACMLCIGIILPMNITACEEGKCNNGLTNYGRTTIANVVSNFRVDDNSNSNATQTTTTMTTDEQPQGFWNIFWTNQSTLHLLRLYAIAMCTWYITYFTLKNIKREWRENLVLRRVYYLEADHYSNRMAELERTVYNHPGGGADEDTWDDDDDSDDEDDAATRRNSEGKDVAIHGRTTTKKKKKHREPWIPHPEHRDTVPSIELYSVLVGGLPSLPDEVVNSKDMQTALGFSKRASIDWQLAVATTFFDHCVPNQPGFSSSVVAVTILPGAPELAKAWRKWYSAAAALRRLRFIRQVIKEKRYYDIDDVDEESGAQPSSSSSVFKPTNSDREMMSQPNDTQNVAPSRTKVTFLNDNFPSSPPEYREDEGGRLQQPQTMMTQNNVRGLGKQAENSSDVGYYIFRTLNYGPEQQAVYTREMAQGAAACCPNGCCEGRVRRLPIDRLLEMEDATIVRLEKAQYELQCAQMKAAVSIVDAGEKTVRKPLREDSSGVTDFVLQQRTASRDSQFPEYSSSDSFRMNGGGRSDMDVNGFKVQAPTMKHQGSIANDLRKTFPPLPIANNVDGDVFRGPSFSSSVVNECVGWEANLGDRNLIDTINVPQSNDIFQPLPSLAEAMCKSDMSGRSPILPTSSRSSNILRMNSEGRFLFDSATTHDDDDDELSKLSKFQSTAPTLRRRANTAQSAYSEGDISRASNQWNQVNTILRTTDADDESSSRNKRDIETGVWVKPSFKSFVAAVKSDFLATLRAVGRWTKGKTDPLTSTLAKDSTYAVVTFSSRQASVAARHCLADGRGVQRWLSVETVPVPPLADSAPCDIITCRGCCRPVTLNINNNQLMLRRYIALASLVFIYVFYTIPITAAQSLVAPQTLQKTLPGLQEWLSQSKYLSAEIMSGLVSALLYTSFFALCPVMFKAIANSGSQATSVQEAEKFALQYYWYFMLVTAFVFTGLADAAINILNHRFDNLEQSIEVLMENIASQTPLTTAATWLNWIIVRTTMTLPLQYLLQVNSFIFGCLGMKCCARCVMGGGPGGPIPYRIYVDGGVVFLCVVSLAPQSPLVAPVALLYYLVCVPLWRRNCIFVYRPKFDSGGERWPFLSDMLITSLFMGQFLLTLQMLLRDAFGPAILAAVPSIPTYLYRNFLINRFRRAYDDAGLLQTSLLDGWDNTIPTSVEKREEFRQFLVDAHKAAYIPVCIAGGATNILTAEPAVVIPSENDDMLGYADVTKNGGGPADISSPTSYNRELSFNGFNTSESPTLSNQPGAFMRRAMSFSAQTPRSIVSPSNLSDLVDAANISGGDSSSGGPLESPVSMFLQKINSREEC